MSEITDTLVSIPVFGMVLTLISYWAGLKLHERFPYPFLQPILTASIMVIIILKIFGVEYQVYNKQNAFLNYMLAPAAVVLAVPLYRNIHILKRNIVPIIAGVVCGCLTTMGCCIFFAWLFGANKEIIVSMIPKGVTNPIAIEVSSIIGGIPELTIAMVVFTGIFGGTFGPEVIRLLRIKNKVAKGIALGSMCHAIGTARAFKEGEIEGAMSSLAMGLAGIFTAIAAPIIAGLLL